MFSSNDLMVCMEAMKPEALGELFTTSSEGDGAGVCVFPGLASSPCWCIFLCCSACSRPLGGRWKCNLDAALFRDLLAIGLGMVMRRNDGQFYACKTLRMPLSCNVKEVEALALREALIWALSLKLDDVEFETDSLLVVNSLSSYSLDCSEYGFLISDCVCLRGNGNYSIRFVKRQANKCAHVLTRHACFNASLYESFVIPSWLEEVILSDLSSI